MDFAFTDEQRMIAETARGLFGGQATSDRVRRAMAADGIDRDLWKTYCGELGLSGIGIAEELGGLGLGLVELAIVAEAAGAAVAALPMLGSLALSAQAIAHGGSATQQAEWLPRLLSGDVIAAFVDDGAIRAVGDRLTGAYDFAAHGASAELLLVTDGEGAWLVVGDDPHVRVRRLTTMDQTRPYARVELDGARGARLADPVAALQAARDAGYVVIAAEALGGAQECLDRTVAYAKERVQFGRPIGSFQAYKHRLADMMIAIEQARSAVYWAACAVDERASDASLAVHAAKSFAADTYFRCAGDMIQLHGGIGFTWEHDAHLFFKRARALQTMLGSGAWHREAIAAMLFGDAA